MQVGDDIPPSLPLVISITNGEFETLLGASKLEQKTSSPQINH
jgi:hypothetical protein